MTTQILTDVLDWNYEEHAYWHLYKGLTSYEVKSRLGNTKEELFKLISDYGYEWKIVQSDCNYNSLQYDILAQAK